MAAFLDLGGYAAYVWPAYLFTAAALIGLLVTTLRDLRSRESALRSRQGAKR